MTNGDMFPGYKEVIVKERQVQHGTGRVNETPVLYCTLTETILNCG
jgi:hypothetical protein